MAALAGAAAAQMKPAQQLTTQIGGRPATLLVLPFENRSKAPGIEWIGEAFPEILAQRMASPTLHTIGRAERLQAFDRYSIPLNLRPSRATLVKIAELMDADYAVLGEYNFNGQTFSAKAQLLDMQKLKLSPAVQQAGPLPKLIDIQTALAWELQRLLVPDLITSRNQFVNAFPAVRLDAFENYIRGIIAVEPAERLRRLRDALRQNPSYAPAMLALGKEQYEAREYQAAMGTLGRVPRHEPIATEANFFLGLAAFYAGDFTRAQQAFEFVAARLPLTEVTNNLGVVAGRRSDQSAVGLFRKAVDADPNDADYHFNLGVALQRSGDAAAAEEQWREAVRLNPSDAEAKTLLGMVAPKSAPPRTGARATRAPLERIKTNYDEAPFRQLALEIQRANEERMSGASPQEHARFHVDRGEQLLARGFVGEAEREFREAILLDPTSPGAHLGLAEVLAASDDAAGARAEAQASARLKPSASAFVLLARLDMKENNLESAGHNLSAALALEPTHAGAQALKKELAVRTAAQPPRRT
jgi:tetratricopeptide (TPR) repeat protein